MAKKNLKQASKKSIYESRVQQLDGLGSNLSEFLQEESMSALEKVAVDFIARVQENINNEPAGMVKTGKMSDIRIKAEDGSLDITGVKHLIYQDRGVNGFVNKLYQTPHSYTDKMPPVQVFIDYIKENNLRLRNNETYYGDPSKTKELTEEQQIKKAAWGMAVNVFKNGFKPRKIFSKEIPQLIEEAKIQVSNFAVQSIKQYLAGVKPSAERVILPKKIIPAKKSKPKKK